MPKQLILSRVPVDLSVIEYDLDGGEEVFLTYTWQRSSGPNIVRRGTSSPEITLIGKSGKKTVSEFGLRLGSWFVQERLVPEELRELEVEFADVREKGSTVEEVEVLEQVVTEVRGIDEELRNARRSEAATPAHFRAHDSAFEAKYPAHRIIGQQGCANLTMQHWCVAYVNNRLGADGSEESPHTLVCLFDEKVEQRNYSCLIKWKPFLKGGPRVTIEEAKFSHRSNLKDDDRNGMAEVQFNDLWLPRGDSIEFAVSGQQIIRDGEVVPVATVCHQFEDLRHLLQMPNLNPDCPLYEDEEARHGRYRPRPYFGEEQAGDIWLGEDSLLEDQNLLRAALTGAITLKIPSSASDEQLSGAMRLAGYRQATSLTKPLSPGQWRYVRSDKGSKALEVYFKRNTYSWTMIGLSSDNRRLLSLACTGIAGKSGYTVEEAAELLLRVGAFNALLIDQGKNVFQKVDRGDGVLADVVPGRRRRLRATLIFARRDEPAAAAAAPSTPEE
jgi:hypothetical protein